MVGQNANRTRDAELDETVVDGVHPAAKPGRGACTCLVRSARAAPPRRCRTGPPAQHSRRLWREPRALCVRDSPHLDGGSDRRLGPRLALRKAPRHRQPVSGSEPPDPAHAVMNGVHRLAKTPQTLSPQHVQGSIETSHLQSYLELHVLVQPPKLAQQRPRVDDSKGAATGPVTTADVTQGKDCRRHPKMSW